MEEHEELIGADYIEHNIHQPGQDLTRTVSVLGNHHNDIVRGHVPVGKNKVSSIPKKIHLTHYAYKGSHGLLGDELLYHGIFYEV